MDAESGNVTPSDIAFSASVKAAQERLGSRRQYALQAQRRPWPTEVNEDLATFLSRRDTFYLATASAAGQPYIQHRGGPPGFLRVLDKTTLGFADLPGNRQYVTIGNLAENPAAFIFLMDYANQTRVKLWGNARAVEGDAALIGRLSDGLDLRKPPERAIVFELKTWDINCRQHITPRFTEEEIRPGVEKLQARILELEAENARLRAAVQPQRE
jgi:predicted pyridoxine 5'-phosphate oxidase superfamily flavin-nucleotide-binding protein